LLDAIGVPGHRQPESGIFFIIPPCAQSHEHPVTAEDGSQLGEVADCERRMCECDVRDNGSYGQRRRQRSDSREQHDGIGMIVSGSELRASRDEQVIGY
jgi:hypothetical protein